jgi:hypothetical protein
MKFFLQILFPIFTIFITNISGVISVAECGAIKITKEESLALHQENVKSGKQFKNIRIIR